MRAGWKTGWTPRPPIPVWQWAEREVDFSRAPSLDTPIHGKYDADYMPYWKEVVECLTNPEIREIAVLKATRAGGSENVLLNAIRYAVAVKPQPTLYVTSDQLSAERFMEKRVVRGLRCAKETDRALRQAKSTMYDISFPTMDFRVTWPRNKAAFRQDGFGLVLCDEVSTWPDYSPDMARRRTDTYPFPHVCWVSSADPAQKRPSDDDPIFSLYRLGDMRKWRCPDPAGGWFTFELGTRGQAGLQWDKSAKREDGTWDYDKVAASAWYQTPGGARIENADRLKTVRAGHWEPTNPHAKASCRSYHVNSFLVPFKSGDFGEIAVAFLKAKAGGLTALRTFTYETLAEPFAQSIESANDDALLKRCAEYQVGQKPSAVFNVQKPATTFVTVDVQKAHCWALAREWVDGGDSGLIDYNHFATWEEIEDFANRYRAVRVGVDCAYQVRTSEVYEYALKCKALPLRGSDNLNYQIVREHLVDPFEGKPGQGRGKILTYIHNAPIFRSILLDMQRGEVVHQWSLPAGVPMEYILQAGSTECIDGVWRTKRGRSQDHLWDCEVYQLVMAYIHRIYRNDFLGGRATG